MSFFFFLLQKSENRQMKQVLHRGREGLYQWDGGRGGERGGEGENIANTVYTCM
jgi:hypothetical protein